MTENGIFQIIFYLVILLALAKPVGWYIAQVYENKFFNPVENVIYKLCHIQRDQEMGWKTYLSAMLLFNLLGILVVFSIQCLQYYLPLNPEHFTAVSPALAFNTAVSFVTNTNWQAYSGESSLSYFTQTIALSVQNFLSAATGMAILMAFIRGITRHENNNVGNFWVDIVRGTLYILLPLATILAIALTSQGVIQNFKPYVKITPIETSTVTEQIIPMGPVASQVAIKQLGTNGGGFFNTNAAHPLENPTPISNFLEMLAILLIPAALCYTYGMMVKDKRQGWAIFIAMFILLVPFIFAATIAEQQGNPAFINMGIDQSSSIFSSGGNMEGKETRFGILNSSLWATATTATSNGSVNAMLDSFTPLGGLVPLWMMHLGEVVFGGVGSGLYGMIILILITVFIAGLMVGRTPEYLGKKIEIYEIKMASFAILIAPIIILLLSSIATVTKAGVSAIHNPGPHGFSEILYAFTSMGSNNGSAFAGLNANTPFYNITGGIEMLIVRFGTAIPILAIAGSLARKKSIPASAGTLMTYSPLFIVLLITVVIAVGALVFLPSIALGPIVEHLILWGQYGH